MNSNRTAVVGLVSAAALALGVQQAGAADVTVSADIVANTTWVSTNVYKLDRLISVRDGATLTIQAGTVIRGLPVAAVPQEPGTLFIARGAKIDAQGTAQNPIVFTDQYDDNIGANKGTVGPNGTDYGKLNNQLTGQWGGLIIGGKSYIGWDSLDASGIFGPDGRITTLCEGLTSTNGLAISYGGADDTDNSGILKYVSIRYGGFILGPTKEINGLTLCGVGRGTTIDHIDIYNTKDDVLECFGGTAGMKHILGWNGTDDQFDTDTGWRGKAQFVLMVQGVSTIAGPGQLPDSSDKAFEFDGAGDKTGFNDDPQSCGTLFNYTLVGLGTNCGDVANTAINLRDNAGARLYNGLVMDFGGGCTLIEGVTNGTWAYANNTNSAYPNYGVNCSSAAKMYQTYAQDSYFGSTNRQGVAMTNYIGYADPYAPFIANVATPSKKVEIKRNVFWNMAIPHSVGLTNGHPTADGKVYVGGDNSTYSTHAHAGAYPDNTGFDIVASGNEGGNLYINGTGLPASLAWPVNSYQRETNTYNFQTTMRPVAHPYTCVKSIDPRANTNFWSILATYGVQPPVDTFFTPVQFVGAMGTKNWAGPWSTPWRLGGMVTNNVPTGDETPITVTASYSAGNINIGIAAGDYAGVNADWWLLAYNNTTAKWYYLKLTAPAGWTQALAATFQGPLGDLTGPISTTGLPAGNYTAIFGVDLAQNATPDFDSLYIAAAVFTK